MFATTTRGAEDPHYATTPAQAGYPIHFFIFISRLEHAHFIIG